MDGSRRIDIARAAAVLLAVFEGPFKLRAYQDPGGVWTIGRGHTKNVCEGMTISREQAVQFFCEDEAPLIGMVLDKATLAAGAYVSFGFNCGRGALDAVLRGLDTIANPKHTTDKHGVVLPGLVSRRALEMLLIASA